MNEWSEDSEHLKRRSRNSTRKIRYCLEVKYKKDMQHIIIMTKARRGGRERKRTLMKKQTQRLKEGEREREAVSDTLGVSWRAL